MGSVLSVTSPKEWQGITQEGAVIPLDSGKWSDDAPDLHLMVVDRQDRLRARCSLWWRNAPPHAARRLGAIGHYAACDDASAAALLQDACLRLAERKCDYAVAPLDGSTWRSYRFVTDPGNSPPFFMEPANPPEYPLQFAAAGFGRFAEYTSALRSGPISASPQADEAERRLEALGVIIRPLDPARLDDELRAIHQASLVIFRITSSSRRFPRMNSSRCTRLYFPCSSPTRFCWQNRKANWWALCSAFPTSSKRNAASKSTRSLSKHWRDVRNRFTPVSAPCCCDAARRLAPSSWGITAPSMR